MLNKLFKSLLVISGTLTFTALLGIIFFSGSFGAMLPEGLTKLVYPGLAVTVFGLLLSLASAIFILKYFIFFTRTRVVDSEGNTLSDNKHFTVTALGILISMAVTGLGFAIMLDSLTAYVVRLFTIGTVLLAIAGTIFLFSVIRHKIRRRFAWIASGVIGFIALIVILAAIPATRDLAVEEGDMTVITATVVHTSAYSGFLSGPGKSVIQIKGTSGEKITLRYSGGRGTFKAGEKYTFYYLPRTHLIQKVKSADNISY